MDARLLAGRPEYKLKPTPQFLLPAENVATTTPEPRGPALNDPEAFQVKPGPVGAQFLAGQDEDVGQPETAPAPAPPAPASALTQPAAPTRQGSSTWTPERKAFAKRINETARRYREMVETRRAQRGALSGYSKLKNQLENAAGKLSELKSLEDTYKDIYTPDSPATMALQRRQAEHFERVQRLRQELMRQAAGLSKRYGLKLGKHGGLEDEDSLAQAGDAAFDDEIKQGYIDALMSSQEEQGY